MSARFGPIILLLLTCCVNVFSQSKTDSLLRLLNKAVEDTTRANLYYQVGASMVNQSPLEALPYFKKGAALARKLNHYRAAERNFNGMSLSYSYVGAYDSAKYHVDTAIYFARIVKDTTRLALVYLNRADNYANLQNFSEAVKNCDTAIAFAEHVNNRSGLGRIYSIMSDVYAAQKQYDRALVHLDKSQGYFEAINNKQMVGMTHFGRAVILQETERVEESVGYFEKAIRIADSMQDDHNLCSYYGGLAQSQVRLNRYREGEESIGKSLKYALATGNRKQEALAYDLYYNVYARQQDYKKAVPYELKAYNILKEEQDLSREYATAYNLAEAYFETGNMGEAYKFLKISRDLNDSMIRQQFNNETAKLQTEFEVSRKDKEIQLLNKDKELQKQRLQKQQLAMIFVGAVALLALAGIWLLMNRNRLKQRMKELELRNQIAADLHDEVGSSLSSIHMLSQMATAQHATAAGSQATILNRVSTNAKETMDRMSDIVWMIKPGETEAGSLRLRMERFANEICESRQLTLKMDLDAVEQIKLSMAQRKNIYLVFKEALNNAVKYSGATQIEINASLQNRLFRLSVKDNGRGFDTGAAGRGNGLDNMRNRARESGGDLAIESTPGKGTELLLSINL